MCSALAGASAVFSFSAGAAAAAAENCLTCALAALRDQVATAAATLFTAVDILTTCKRSQPRTQNDGSDSIRKTTRSTSVAHDPYQALPQLQEVYLIQPTFSEEVPVGRSVDRFDCFESV